MSHSPPILELRRLQRAFGGVHALREVDLTVHRGTITGLIGPNGSGKSTLFQVVSGIDPGGSGDILFNGQSIRGLPPSRIYRRGVARTFQMSRVFPRLTVLENLLVAGRRSPSEDRHKAFGLLDRIHLVDYAYTPAGELSYGQQRLVEFVRALMGDPALLLMDEPAAGINPTLRQVLWAMVQERHRQGTTFILIEHDMTVVRHLCSIVHVLNEGQMIARGDFATIRANPLVMDAYFGQAGLSSRIPTP